MQVEVDVSMMADCRDNRRTIQSEILRRFGHSCLSYSLNIPGTVKDKPSYRSVFYSGLSLLNNKIGTQVLFSQVRFLKTGPEAFFAIDINQIKLKKITVEIEESHPCGRLFDMDVLAEPGKPLSRQELGIDSRKCFICGNPAPVCARNRSHGIEELIKKIDLIAADIR
ncbi:MAG: citrate lyase holo-[acyl-carrier protein] synthase [Spirochaetales bacterium]|nr:citrate lyase holo-[acyl-carrier protein] synthase [Spirochaetales bacterium]